MLEEETIASPEDDLPAGSSLSFGQKIRRMRREANKTLDAVARAIDIPISLLSTFERTSQGLTFKGMHDLATYFGTTIASLNGEEDRPARSHSYGRVVGRIGRERHPALPSSAWLKAVTRWSVTALCLRPRFKRGAYSHAGEEFLHMLSGSLEIILDGMNFFELNAGDSFYFESTRLHSWRNIHDGETVLIWVNTPPTF